MRGFLLLSEGRSGTEWLCSMTNSTGIMGKAQEWLDVDVLDKMPSREHAAKYLDAVISKASTSNGRFAVKLFPRHLKHSHHRYGNDFIGACRAAHNTSIFVLERRDRLRQAISFARAEMTGAWTNDRAKKSYEVYDYQHICKCYFQIEESYAFWRSYLGIHGIEHQRFYYEDLLDDPTPFVRAAAQKLGLKQSQQSCSQRKMQRDSVTEEWVSRFQMTVGKENILAAAAKVHRPKRNIRNLIRFFRKQGF